MSEVTNEDEFDFSDYDLEEDETPVSADAALDFPDVDVQDKVGQATEQLTFTNPEGVTPAEAIATARSWSRARRFVGVGMCLATVRQYYGVPAGIPTAAASWQMSAHKRQVRSGSDCPRGVPVYWTGGSHGAGHIAISIGGGLCYSTDWKESGRIDIARIDEITSRWGLQFRGYTYEVNGVQVWKPAAPIGTVALHNLKPGDKNNDVLELKKRLAHKGYKGFILKSPKFGAGTRKAYAAYQRHLGYSGKDADGVPGTTTLRKLGFRVLP